MSAARIDFQQASPSGGIWHSLNRFLFTLIVLTVLATIGYRMLPEISERRRHQARVAELQAQVEKEKQIFQLNMREETLLKTSPEYVGLIARDRLGLMKEGETIFRVESDKSASSSRR